MASSSTAQPVLPPERVKRRSMFACARLFIVCAIELSEALFENVSVTLVTESTRKLIN